MMHAPALEFTESELATRKVKTQKSLLWLAIVSIIMLFAAFTSAYIVRQGEGKWLVFDLPDMFIVSTLVIVLSSVPMQWAVRSAQHNRQKSLKIGLFLTLVLGLAFVGFQVLAWSELFSQGIAFSGEIGQVTAESTYVRAGDESKAEIDSMGNVAGSFLYVITALHVLHLAAGLLVLAVVFYRALVGRYSSAHYNGVSLCATYWHFLDGLWVYLFFFLLYIR
jgi:cytochrome c oxidase subunit 3